MNEVENSRFLVDICEMQKRNETSVEETETENDL